MRRTHPATTEKHRPDRGFRHDLPHEAVLNAVDESDADEHSVVVDVLGDGELGERCAGGEKIVEVVDLIVAILQKVLPQVTEEVRFYSPTR